MHVWRRSSVRLRVVLGWAPRRRCVASIALSAPTGSKGVTKSERLFSGRVPPRHAGSDGLLRAGGQLACCHHLLERATTGTRSGARSRKNFGSPPIVAEADSVKRAAHARFLFFSFVVLNSPSGPLFLSLSRYYLCTASLLCVCVSAGCAAREHACMRGVAELEVVLSPTLTAGGVARVDGLCCLLRTS